MKRAEIIGVPTPYNIPRSEPRSEHKSKKERQQTGIEEASLEEVGVQCAFESKEIKKAISDMERDKIFEGYQYFVGGMPDLEEGGDKYGEIYIKI